MALVALEEKVCQHVKSGAPERERGMSQALPGKRTNGTSAVAEGGPNADLCERACVDAGATQRREQRGAPDATERREAGERRANKNELRARAAVIQSRVLCVCVCFSLPTVNIS